MSQAPQAIGRYSLPSSVSLDGIGNSNGGGRGPFQPSLSTGLGGNTRAIGMPNVDSHEFEVETRITATVPTTFLESEEETKKDNGPHQLLFICTPNDRLGSFAGRFSGVPREKSKNTVMSFVKSLSRLNHWLRSDDGKKAYPTTDSRELYADWKPHGTQTDDKEDGLNWRTFYVGQRTSMTNYWGINGRQPRDGQFMWVVLMRVLDKKPESSDPFGLFLAPEPDDDDAAPDEKKKKMSLGDLVTALDDRFVAPLRDQIINNGLPTTREGVAVAKHLMVQRASARMALTEGWREPYLNTLRLEPVPDTKRIEDTERLWTLGTDKLDREYADVIGVEQGLLGVVLDAKMPEADLHTTKRRFLLQMMAHVDRKLSPPPKPGVAPGYWQLIPMTTKTHRPPPVTMYITSEFTGSYFYIGRMASVLRGNARASEQNKRNGWLATFPENNTDSFVKAITHIPQVEVFMGHK